jgi:hypothetical protein
MAEPISIRVQSDKPYTLVGEPVPDAPALAISPVWDRDPGGWSGHFAIIHIATGWRIPRIYGCIRCIRRAAAKLAAIPVDWSAMSLDRDNNSSVAREHLDGIQRIANGVWSGCYAALDMCEGAEVPR